MIKTISTPNKIEIIFPLIKKFCKAAKAPYRAGEMAHWLRQSVGSPLMRVVVSDTDGLHGFAVMYLIQDIMTPKLFVSQFYAEGDDEKKAAAKKELSEYIVKTAMDNGIGIITYHTYHDPDWMIERFGEIGYKFEKRGSVLEMALSVEEA